MIDFIPIENYYGVFIHFAFFLILSNLLHAYTLKIEDIKNLKFIRTAGILLFIIVVLYIGLRPISPIFGDMGAYRGYYRLYMHGYPVTSEKDITFHYYMKIMSFIMSVQMFFLLTAFCTYTPCF